MARFLAIVFIIVFVLGFLGGSVWVLDYLAVIDVSAAAQKAPVVGRFFADEAGPEAEDPLVSENKKLAAEMTDLQQIIGKLEHQIKVLETEQEGFAKENEDLKKDLESEQLKLRQEESDKQNYQQLAKYYMEMKPAAAMKIMDNLADEVVIGIFLYLEDEQTAKILSAMDPKRASQLVDLMRE